jgi:hypothetical protein
MTRTLSRNAQRAVLAVPADVSAALDELGIDHRVRGGEAMGLCPAPDHNDRKPSWSCNLKTGQHHCFSCGFGGSFTRLVALTRGIRFDEADLWVRTQRIQHPLAEEEIGRVEERRAIEVRESDLWDCTEPPADELAKRRVSREAAQQLQILWDGKGWVFPIRNPDTGRLIGWQIKRGKTVRNRPIDVEKHRSLFGQELVKSTGSKGDVIVVESPLNAARFLTAGYPRVVATYGIEFSDDQIAWAMKLGTGLLFAQDNDYAGQKKIARWLKEHPLERQFCKVFDYGSVFEDDRTHAHYHRAGDGRDPCDLLDTELMQGIECATSGRRTRFEEFPQWR